MGINKLTEILCSKEKTNNKSRSNKLFSILTGQKCISVCDWEIGNIWELLKRGAVHMQYIKFTQLSWSTRPSPYMVKFFLSFIVIRTFKIFLLTKFQVCNKLESTVYAVVYFRPWKLLVFHNKHPYSQHILCNQPMTPIICFCFCK